MRANNKSVGKVVPVQVIRAYGAWNISSTYSYSLHWMGGKG